jgi:response regulator RpfG family c-di-GMP phosphodiesterase
MPEMPGSIFLREARRVAPLAVRLLLTGYSDADAAISAVNDGRIFRFLSKPCGHEELLKACAEALWQHRLQRTERDLLEQTLHGAVKALTDVLALAVPTVFGRGARLKELVSAPARALAPESAWEVEVAALLAPLGAVTLPVETAERLYAGEALLPAEAEMVARVPEITQRLLANIPRLDGVLAILEHQQRPFDDPGAPIGARILRIAADYLELEAAAVDPPIALQTMRRGVYDPVLLESFAQALARDDAAPAVAEIGVCDLEAGMTLACDAHTVAGRLLIARGQTVTAELLARVRNLPHGYLIEPLHVVGST